MHIFILKAMYIINMMTIHMENSNMLKQTCSGKRLVDQTSGTSMYYARKNAVCCKETALSRCSKRISLLQQISWGH
jgi:hypothetical protein